MSSWLHKKRKGELIELAQQANLPETDGLLKDDLITALEAHLAQNESTYGKKSAFSDYYKRTGSPVKRERPSPTEAGTLVISKPRRRQSKLMEQEDSQEETTPQKALTTRTPRTVSRVTSQIDFPASPRDLANVAEQQFNATGEKAKDLWKKTKIEEGIEYSRQFLSSVVIVQGIVLSVEALGLQFQTLKWGVSTTPEVPSLGIKAYNLRLPDLWLLLTSDFWAPTTLWSLTSFFVPLVFSYFVNLTLRSNTKHRSNKGTYAADPLTFNIVKGLLVYIVYPLFPLPTTLTAKYKHPAFWPFSSDTVSTVSNAVPGGPAGLLIGAGVGILAAIYDAALKK